MGGRGPEGALGPALREGPGVSGRGAGRTPSHPGAVGRSGRDAAPPPAWVGPAPRFSIGPGRADVFGMVHSPSPREGGPAPFNPPARGGVGVLKQNPLGPVHFPAVEGGGVDFTRTGPFSSLPEVK